MRRQLTIGIEHDDQRNALKIVPLCDHLSADEHIDFARMHRIERFLRSVTLPRRVAIDTRNLRCRQQRTQRFFDALRALTHALQVLIAACRASAGHRSSVSAVMTAQRPIRLVENRKRRTTRAI